jgi:hypothetical protein
MNAAGSAPPQKTFEEHLHFLRESVKLKLWFLWNWLREHPGEEPASAMHKRVNIYRKCGAWKGHGVITETDLAAPVWVAMTEKTCAIYERHRDDPDASGFEREAFEVFSHSIEEGARSSFAARPRFQRKCGSLRYDPPGPDHPRRISFHIFNDIQPHSVFEDRAYLPHCFLELMDRTEADYGADALRTATWLNEYPRWLELFPQEWHDNMGPPYEEVGYGMGHWGQFVNARGCFNEKYGRILRRTGRFPFYPRDSWCSFRAMRAHLIRYLANEA